MPKKRSDKKAKKPKEKEEHIEEPPNVDDEVGYEERHNIQDPDERPVSAMIELHSKPEGAIIIVNGTNTGQKTPYAFEFPPGEHMIGMALPEKKQSEEIVTGSSVDLSLKLDEVFSGVVSKMIHIETALDRVLEKLDELKTG